MGCKSSKSAAAAAAPVTVPPAADVEEPKVQIDGEVESGETRVPSEADNATDASGNLQAVLEILRNVLVGFTGEALPAVMTVLKTSGEALQDFRGAVEAFQAQDAVRGLRLVADSLQTLATALGDANMAKEQVDNFVRVLEMLRDPKQILFTVGRELLVNGKDILGRIEKAVAAFNAQDWQTFGQELGGIIVEVLLPAEAQTAEAAPPVDAVGGSVTEEVVPLPADVAAVPASSSQGLPVEGTVEKAEPLPVEAMIEKVEPRGNVATGGADQNPSATNGCTEAPGSVEEEDTTAKDDAVPEPILVQSQGPAVQKSGQWLFGSCCSVAMAA
eukprot:TRINITY_DN4416_c0_g1_i1.p1 TRINITY_DN4416_c0_g1~~TRINITY_DN4416_c0_g1_i1.p1  ORF type:complete len:330 (-),score=86.93 TRINITY_DN4416_c0_g1_i1:279-1268(-)